MTNPIENKITHAANSVEPSAEFTQRLWNQMRLTSRKESAPQRVSRFVWVPALTVLGILVVMVLVAPQTVLAAVKGLLAYIPGLGFVEKDESTLYLAEPIVVEKDGYSFSLDQVVADTNKVAIVYHMISPTANFIHCSYNENFLLWSDGKSNNPIGGGLAPDAKGGITAQIDFFPLPEGMTQASLKVSADPTEPGCAAPKEWIIPFSLGKEVPDIEILPVVENANAQVTPSMSQPTCASSADSSINKAVQFFVGKYVELNDGYLLTGHIENQEKSWQSVSIDMLTVSAYDANGKKLTVEQTNENFYENEFALKVVGKDFSSPLTIQVKKLLVMESEEEAPSFSFDAGSDSKMDQRWIIDQEVEFAGRKIKVNEIKIIEDTTKTNYPNSVIGFQTLASSTNDISFSFDCSGMTMSSSRWNQSATGNGIDFSVENYYPDGIPDGIVTCKILNAFIQEEGDWQFDWQPASAAK